MRCSQKVERRAIVKKHSQKSKTKRNTLRRIIHTTFYVKHFSSRRSTISYLLHFEINVGLIPNLTQIPPSKIQNFSIDPKPKIPKSEINFFCSQIELPINLESIHFAANRSSISLPFRFLRNLDLAPIIPR